MQAIEYPAKLPKKRISARLGCRIAKLQTLPAHASLSRRRASRTGEQWHFSEEGRLFGAIFHSGRDTERRTDRQLEMSHLLCVEDEREEGEVGRQQLRASHDAGNLKGKKRCEL